MICLHFVVEPAAAGQNVVVVLDDSGSMGDKMRRKGGTTKIAAAKSALVSVLETLPNDARVGVVTLNGSPAWAVPFGPVDMESTRRAIMGIRARGGTPLGRFMKVGGDALLEARKQDHYGSYRLLIVTDGEAGDRRLVKRYLPDILARGLTVDVIGVDMADRHSLATQVHSYRRADDPNMLATAVREVFAETSATATDAGQSDFDLLEAIPSECASAALLALSETGNHPIGESAARAADMDRGDDPYESGSAHSNSRSSSRKGRSSLGVVGLFVVFLVFAVLINLLKAGIRAARR